MVIDVMSALALAGNCAPVVAPVTLVAVARAESALDPLSIGVNGPAQRSLHPRSRQEAVQIAQSLDRRGLNFDLGLTQINVRNLPRLGMRIADAFDPCRNLAGGARLLTDNYLDAARKTGPRAALQVALSVYNTGDASRGVRNGYVARVYRAAGAIVPAIGDAAGASPAAEPVLLHADSSDPGLGSVSPATLDPFGGGDCRVLVWRPCAMPPRDRVGASASSPSPGSQR